VIWIARAVCIPQVGTIFQQILGAFFTLVSSANFLHVHSTKHVWCVTVRSKDLQIMEGKYFLADSGFPHHLNLLVPYQNVHYHLAEWHRAQLR